MLFRFGWIVVVFSASLTVSAQQNSADRTVIEPGRATEAAAPLTVHGKWKNFLKETASPMTIVGAAFNAGTSQAMNTDPKYGVGSVAYGQRFGAGLAGIASQNFFGDFLTASATHEDPRYFREGSGYGFWNRVGYAISRAAVIRKDDGGTTFNWSNVVGAGASAGLAEAYYPPASRTASAVAINFETSYIGTGLVNLVPEFWPDLKRKLFHHPGRSD